jgi:fructose-1,6-bisphosphatase/inositol monophosphatase family enzyme
MGDISPSMIREALEFAETLVTDAGELIRARSDGAFQINRKRDGSLVTEIDLLVEREIRDRIKSRWPDHSVEGEEEGLEAASSEYRWLIDPIDGTMSLAHGVPLFGTIVALQWKGESVVGVINLPILRRCYSAGRGVGARRNGKTFQLSNVGNAGIDGEIIALGDRQQFERAGLAATFDAIMESHRWVRTYTDCFGHCLAAEGAVGAMFDPGVHPWDFAATQVLVREAGGRFEMRAQNEPGQFIVIFGKPAVVQWILDQIP